MLAFVGRKEGDKKEESENETSNTHNDIIPHPHPRTKPPRDMVLPYPVSLKGELTA